MKTNYFKVTVAFIIWFCSGLNTFSTHAQTVLINTSSIWKYLDNGSNQGTNWRTTSFNDTTWHSGASELGYGDAPVTQLTHSKIGYYFRKNVNVVNPSQFTNFTMKIRRDDGIVVYINNVEVYRNNMPTGVINYNTLARTTCSDDGNAVFTIPISNSFFVNGTNLIAAEVHNRSTSSSDITFEMQLIGNPIPVAPCDTPYINLFGNMHATSTSVVVNWWPVPGVTSYNVEFRNRNVFANYSAPINTTADSMEMINLTPSTDYEFIVQSVCAGNVLSGFSDNGFFSTLPGQVASCPVPDVQTFDDTNTTTNSSEIFWSPVAGAQSYNVEYRIQTIGANYSAPINTANDTLLLDSLLPNTDYEFIVQSVCPGNIMSAFSSEAAFSTLPVIIQTCSVPDDQSFGDTDITSNSTLIFWDPIPGVQSYNVEYRIQNVGANFSAPINTINDSLQLNNLLPLTDYEFIVQSVCPGNLLSAFSPSASFTTLTAIVTFCPIPNYHYFGVTNRTSNSAQVFWTPVPGISSYNVAYRIRNIGAIYSNAINTTTTSLVLTNLQPLTNYEFIVQSVCSGTAFSAFSQSGWFTTLTGGGPTTTLVRGPYLTVSTSSSITIQWRTSTATSNEVKFDTIYGQLNNNANNLIVSTEHSITLNGLSPNKKYYYSIGPFGSVLQGDANNYFYTAPATGSTQPVKFWVTGDFGNGSAGQTAVRNSFTSYTAGQTVNGWIWLGDNAYNNGTDQEYQTNVFNVYNPLFKNIPVFPTPGNHDYAQAGYQSSASLGLNFPYFNIFTLPIASGTEKYYSTNYGSIHFISLDSYGSYNNSSSAMYNWLNNDLMNNTQQWTIVYFHHPPYSKGGHNSDTEIELIDMRNNIIPLLESYGVDLVLCGHSHIYERSYFIKDHTGLENTFNPAVFPAGNVVQPGAGPYSKTTRTGNGTVYVVCGVSGQSGGTTMPGYPHNAMYRSITNSFGSLILNVSGTDLTCQFLTSAGAIGDQFTIQKPFPAPVAFPRVSGLISETEANPFIYPNPSVGDINIRINNEETIDIRVSIYDMEGNLIFNKKYFKSSDDLLIDRSEIDLRPGIYIVNVDGENIKAKDKLIIY